MRRPFGAPALRAVGLGARVRGVAAGLADLLVLRPEPAATEVASDVTLAADVSVGALAVLSAAEDARAVGVAAAGILARRARAACALACVWTAPEPHRHPEARPPAGRASRRLAAALSARGLDALPCGAGRDRRPPAGPGRSRGRRGARGGGRGRRPGSARPRRPARGRLRRPARRAGPRPRRHAPGHGRRDRGARRRRAPGGRARRARRARWRSAPSAVRSRPAASRRPPRSAGRSTRPDAGRG